MMNGRKRMSMSRLSSDGWRKVGWLVIEDVKKVRVETEEREGVNRVMVFGKL